MKNIEDAIRYCEDHFDYSNKFVDKQSLYIVMANPVGVISGRVIALPDRIVKVLSNELHKELMPSLYERIKSIEFSICQLEDSKKKVIEQIEKLKSENV